MSFRLLHTSDWHLGHTLHDVARVYEFECFFTWLLDTLEAERIDALVIAGDIFDVANPSAAAQQLWYRFLSRARQRFPQLDIVAIAGNHDSASRLEAPRALLEELNIQVIGWLPREESGALDLHRLLVSLHDDSGDIAAWCAAVPFLRPADLPRQQDSKDPLIDGVRQVYGEVLQAAAARCAPNQALIATGHCYMTASKISDLSERKILGGNEHALPADIFPSEVSYVALGHLHLAQEVAEQRHIRYCGSPIPLSMSEIDYPHQVCVATFEGQELVALETPLVPRSIDLLRIPATGPKEKQEVLAELRNLPDYDDEAGTPAPFLEVRIRLEKPESGLRSEVAQALEGKNVRFVKLSLETTGTGGTLRDVVAHQRPEDLKPEEVFRSLYQSKHQGEPPTDVMDCFYEILELAEGGEGQ